MADKFEKQRNLCWQVPGIKQATKQTCWCAALAWWAKALGDRPKLSKHDIYFRNAKYAIGGWAGSNLITPESYKIVLSDPTWKAKPEIKKGGFGPSFLDSKLGKGPMIVGYYHPSGGHVVVVVAPSITFRRENKYMVMDPAYGEVRAYSYGRFSSYNLTIIATPL